jgi:hypothetical protein
MIKEHFPLLVQATGHSGSSRNKDVKLVAAILFEMYESQTYSQNSSLIAHVGGGQKVVEVSNNVRAINVTILVALKLLTENRGEFDDR